MKRTCKYLHTGYVGTRSAAECTADPNGTDCQKQSSQYQLNAQCWDEIRYCDYCGEVANGIYSKCDKCGKDICAKHLYPFTNEETSLCVECARI